MKRTNVVLDEELLSEAKHRTGIKTTRAVIDRALRELVELGRQADLRKLRGAVDWDADLDELRRSREF